MNASRKAATIPEAGTLSWSYGNTDASTTRSPSTPRTRIEVGSMTAMSSTPIFVVHDGCSAVSASRATQSMISSSV